MADLEQAADVALVKVKELSEHIDGAEAALSAVEERVADVRTQLESDWTALDEKAQALMEVARTQLAGIADEGQKARHALGELGDAIGIASSDWDEDIERSRSEVASFGTRLSEAEPVVATAADQTHAVVRTLAERATAIEGQLQQAVSEAWTFLEDEVVSDLREMQEAIRERADTFRIAAADECETLLDEAMAAWQQQLLRVEEVIEQEFVRVPEHAIDVVDFSLYECRRGHDEACAHLGTVGTDLQGVMQKLAEAVRAHTGQMGECVCRAERTLCEAVARVERAHSLFLEATEVMERYDFVRR